MGHTNYWQGQADATPELLGQIQALFDSTDIPLANGHGDAGTKPFVNSEMVFFNGSGDDMAETFYVKFGADDWGFCKTYERPYDQIVVAVLVLIEQANPGTFSWHADSDWNYAMGRAMAAVVSA